MHRILLLGAGKIGRMIAKFLASTPDYRVVVADENRESLALVAAQSGVQTACLDAANPVELLPLCQGQQAVISALSYQFNPLVAQGALQAGACYFDLTEDIATTRAVREIAHQARSGQIFMPQCGLAPGFVSIVANHLTRYFDKLDSVYMRVGALPQFPTNALRYNLTWSTDGLINEYCNFCEVIHEGRRLEVLAARRTRTFLARRRPLRSLQYLGWTGHAVRNVGRPGADAQLQNGPLQRPP